MSLSDKFYEGLTSPLPVAGAQMPIDLVPYAGGSLDALKLHKQKYKQLARLQRHSDQIAKRMREEAEDIGLDDYEDDTMDKVSFIGSNPTSRRAYYLSKLAEQPPTDPSLQMTVVPDPDPGADPSSSLPPPDPTKFTDPSADPGPVTGQRTEQQVIADQANAQIAGYAQPIAQRGNQSEPYELGNFGRSPAAIPESYPKGSPAPTVGEEHLQYTPPTLPNSPLRSRTYSNQYDGGSTRFVGQGPNVQALGDSGDVARRLSEFGSAVGTYRDKKYEPKQQERGFFDRALNTLEHYGTRAARGLATGAQMGASKLYDLANRGGYLEEDSFIGRNVRRDLRQRLNEEMADINASLYHSYDGSRNKPGSQVYAERYKGIDADLDQAGFQNFDNNLLDADTFRNDQIRKQMALRGDFKDSTERANVEREMIDTINNYYGFPGNKLNTGIISDDLDGTAFNRALRQAGSSAMINPMAVVAQGKALEDMLASNPAMLQAFQVRFGEEAQQAGVPLTTFVANKLSEGLDPRLALLDEGADKGNIADDIYETDAQRLERYNTTRDIAQDMLNNMSPEDQASFIRAANPRVIQQAEEINALMDSDPQRALAQINAMDPEEAKFLLDQVSMFSQYISPESAQRNFNYDDYRISEDDENFFGGLFNFGGSDIVNRARQRVGAGGNIDDMEDAARDKVFGYNSMRDVPRGRFYLAEDGTMGNTYFNPETGEVNYELGTDLFSRGSGLLSPDEGTTKEFLPQRFHQQYRDAVGAENSALRDDYYLVDDGRMGNYYYNPYSGDRNYELFYGNSNKFQNKPLPQQFHEQYRKQFNRSPSYRG